MMRPVRPVQMPRPIRRGRMVTGRRTARHRATTRPGVGCASSSSRQAPVRAEPLVALRTLRSEAHAALVRVTQGEGAATKGVQRKGLDGLRLPCACCLASGHRPPLRCRHPIRALCPAPSLLESLGSGPPARYGHDAIMCACGTRVASGACDGE